MHSPARRGRGRWTRIRGQTNIVVEQISQYALWRLAIVRQAPGTAMDERPHARETAPPVFADILIVAACASFAGYLLNGYVIRQFFAEFMRLAEKFLW